MTRTTKYVGLDIHQASTVVSVREARGGVIARSVLPTDGGVLTEFVRSMRGTVHITFEEGTQAQLAARSLGTPRRSRGRL